MYVEGELQIVSSSLLSFTLNRTPIRLHLIIWSTQAPFYSQRVLFTSSQARVLSYDVPISE
jgi:hypothetical protein